jgi:hypothetical protein
MFVVVYVFSIRFLSYSDSVVFFVFLLHRIQDKLPLFQNLKYLIGGKYILCKKNE